MEQDQVTKLTSDIDKSSSRNPKPEYKPSYGERWDKAQATKKVVFFAAVLAIILTIVVGFNWGGWVTGGTAQTMANDAVVQRLSTICVGQFNQDPEKEQKLTELNDAKAYQRDDYVKEQGWATMPGEDKSSSKVADTCAKLIVQIDQ